MAALLGSTALHYFVFPHPRMCGRVHVHHGVHTRGLSITGFHMLSLSLFHIFVHQHSSFPCEILILQVPLKSCDAFGIFLDLPILSSTIPRLFVLTVSRVH